MSVEIGEKAPDFTLPSSTGEPVTLFRLLEQAGKQAVVIFFYPKDDTPGCTVEACGFRDEYDVFMKAGGRTSSASARIHCPPTSASRISTGCR